MHKRNHRRPRRIVSMLVALAITAPFIRSPSRAIQPTAAKVSLSSASAYHTNSPHWSHIDIADWGTQARLLYNSTARQDALAWYTAHVDTMSVGMDTFAYRADWATSLMLKSMNPTFKVFGSDIDQYMCQHMGCWDTHAPNTAQSDLPEDYYLHFSQDTHIDFFNTDGKTTHGDIDIPGCPEPGPVTAACRVQFYIYSQDTVWVPNTKNTSWQAWFADHLLDDMSSSAGTPNPIDTVFLDGHSPGISSTMNVGVQNVITSGGTIREYGGQAPVPSTWIYYPSTQTWGPAFTQLDNEYNADISNWLSYLRSRLAAHNKSIRINIGDNITPLLTVEQTTAANGAMTEHMNKATNHVFGARYYQMAIAQIRRMTANGGTIDFAGSVCDNGPAGFPAGQYASGLDRYRMWSLADYYIMKQATTEPGIVYFDPGLCLEQTSTTPAQDLESQWLRAYEIDVGQPVSEPVVVQHGPVACDDQGYAVFSRQYTNALVLVRPRDGYWCQDYSDSTTVTVPLDPPMAMLRPDGTLSEPMTNVSLRNAEAVILMPPPDTMPPAAVNNLRAE